MEEKLRRGVNALDVSNEFDVLMFKNSSSKNLESLKIKVTPSVETLEIYTHRHDAITHYCENLAYQIRFFYKPNPTGTVHVTRHTITEPIGSQCMWEGGYSVFRVVTNTLVMLTSVIDPLDATLIIDIRY